MLRTFVRAGFIVALAALAACASKKVDELPPPSDGFSSHTMSTLRTWDGSAVSEGRPRYRPEVGTRGMVTSDDRDASAWGAEILRQGGNAVDAAVATAFYLAVSRPRFASLGGGGFIVYCPAQKKPDARTECVTIDYRERAPSAATRDMYVRDGKARTDLSQDGALASGVPGVPAGLLLALEKYGTMSRQKLLSRPIEVARRGFRFSGHMEGEAEERWNAMNLAARSLLGCGGKVCPAGTAMKQPDLARVLEEISKKGRDGFYRGWVAKKIADGILKGGGVLTEKDLAAYEAKVREPVSARFRDTEVISMGPPSSGGTIVLQLLKYSQFAADQGQLDEGPGAASTVHAIAHAMSLSFADRAAFFGDPDHVSVPVVGLLDESYIRDRWDGTFKADKANLPASEGKPSKEPTLTTHFSVIDRDGGGVALTTTVNDAYGSGFVPPGTGVFMNNEMDDFSIQPGTPNLFGLVGGEANSVAAGKRPLSSMSPTIVRDRAGRVRLVLGAQGGPRIITAVFQALLNRLVFGLALTDAVIAPRVHQQWKPAHLTVEAGGLSGDTKVKLRAMGYELKDGTTVGKMHALERFENGRTWGVSDPRAEGGAVAE